MTQTQTNPCPAEPSMANMRNQGLNEINIDQIMDSFQSIGEDIAQIGKLNVEEKTALEQFLESLLRYMQPIRPSIEVSTSILPASLGKVKKARIYATGILVLTFEDEHSELKDLSETKNRDLMVAVFGDLVPKLGSLTPLSPEEKQKPPQVKEIPVPPAPQPPAPELIKAVSVEAPVSIEEPAPKEEPEAPQQISPFSAEELAKIKTLETDTLEFIELLSNEKFEHSPISRFFDDWMVNLRQVVLSFASNGIITPDEEFDKQFKQIFNEIEEQLAQRLLSEAEIEVSTKTLEENKTLLNEMNAGYAAQTKEHVVKGKSAIDFLINNVKHLEQELAELNKVKTSYLHPLKKLARDQKQSEINQKLTAARKRLALAVQGSTVKTGGLGGDIDAEYAAQAKELAAKRKLAMGFLEKEVRQLNDELNKLYMEDEPRNPIKKLTRENKIIDLNLRLDAARKRLRLAEQDSGAEQKKLQEEYMKKKQAMLGQMQNLEKDIKTKEVDSSGDARKAACNALANAVKSLIQRKISPPTNEQTVSEEEAKDSVEPASKPEETPSQGSS
jgi:hypothetical protein